MHLKTQMPASKPLLCPSQPVACSAVRALISCSHTSCKVAADTHSLLDLFVLSAEDEPHIGNVKVRLQVYTHVAISSSRHKSMVRSACKDDDKSMPLFCV